MIFYRNEWPFEIELRNANKKPLELMNKTLKFSKPKQNKNYYLIILCKSCCGFSKLIWILQFSDLSTKAVINRPQYEQRNNTNYNLRVSQLFSVEPLLNAHKLNQIQFSIFFVDCVNWILIVSSGNLFGIHNIFFPRKLFFTLHFQMLLISTISL